MKIHLNTQIFIGALLGIFFGIVLGHSSLPAQTSPSLSFRFRSFRQDLYQFT